VEQRTMAVRSHHNHVGIVFQMFTDDAFHFVTGNCDGCCWYAHGPKRFSNILKAIAVGWERSVRQWVASGGQSYNFRFGVKIERRRDRGAYMEQDKFRLKRFGQSGGFLDDRFSQF